MRTTNHRKAGALDQSRHLVETLGAPGREREERTGGNGPPGLEKSRFFSLPGRGADENRPPCCSGLEARGVGKSRSRRYIKFDISGDPDPVGGSAESLDSAGVFDALHREQRDARE